MSGNDRHDTPDTRTESDGGTVARPGPGGVDYLDREVNLVRPSTPFMRDHLRLIWTGFVAWILAVFGPVTATALAPDLMTTPVPVLGFPLHYLLVSVGAPGGSLVLAVWYTRKRDQLDQQYGIDHRVAGETAGSDEATAADGGVDS
jgi:putative solute:sodium symporter small subunit